MPILLLTLSLFISIFLESTLIQLPLTLIVLLIFLIVLGRSWLIIFALFSGVFLDITTLKPIGESSIFFILFLFLVLLYEQKYELKTSAFAALTATFGSGLYLIIFGSTHLFLQIVMCAILGVALFAIFSRMKIWNMDRR